MPRTISKETATLKGLAIGEEVVFCPASEETPERALSRWRKRLPELKKDGLSFRSRVSDGAVHIQRTPEGMNRQTADLAMMKVGEYLLLKIQPLPADVKKARDLADYATKHVGPSQGRFGTDGIWLPIKDQCGRLLIICVQDVTGAMLDHVRDGYVPSDATVKLPWAGERP